MSKYQTVTAVNDYVDSTGTHKNTDFIYFLTATLYSRWEAEGSEIYGDTLKMNFYGTVEDGEVHTSNNGKGTVVSGPGLDGYMQSVRYKYTNRYNNNPTIAYTARFRLRLKDYSGDENAVICSIKVIKRDLNNVVTENLREIYAYELSSDAQNFDISYSLAPSTAMNPFPANVFLGPTYLSNYSNGIEKPSAEFNLVKFQVDYNGEGDLIIDYIEALDSLYQKHFINEKSNLDSLILKYNSAYSGVTNLKYYHTLDEPHSIDSWHPIRQTDSILALLSNKRLNTHFYPAFDGVRDGINISNYWNCVVKPKLANFWFFPYTPAEQEANTITYGDRHLETYAIRLNDQFKSNSNYAATVQAWGYWDFLVSPPTYVKYRRPSAAELNAQVMMALSFGAKMILFEPFYEYLSWLPELDRNVWVKSIISCNQDTLGTYNSSDSLYSTAKRITTRLNGNLGDELLKLRFTGQYAQWRYHENLSNTIDTVEYEDSASYFKFTPEKRWIQNFQASLFKDNIDSSHIRAFLVSNISSTPYSIDTVHYKLKMSNDPTYTFHNYVMKNAETGNETYFADSIVVNDTLLCGDGKLYKILPAVKFGGKILVNDTINSTETLTAPLTIESSISLKVNSNYTLNANITINSGSKIVRGNTGRLFVSGSANINIINWSDSLANCETSNGNHPALFWGSYYFDEEQVSYKIERKIEGASVWTHLTTITANKYVDTTLSVVQIGGAAGTNYLYRITPVINNTALTSPKVAIYNIVGQNSEKSLGNNGTQGKVFEYNLYQNYPNPFNPNTKIAYSLKEQGKVLLKIYDITGATIRTLVNAEQEAGNYEIDFYGDGNNKNSLSSGIYFYRIEVTGQNAKIKFANAKKMIYLK